MTAISIEDLRSQARARLPRAIFDYIDGGSTDERTLAANRAAFEAVTFLPRCLTDVSSVSQKVTVLGREQDSPIILGPVGMCGLAARYGDAAAARAAKAANVGYALSTMSIASVEDVAADSGNSDIWFQLYVMRDRGVTKALIERAKEAGCSALVLTVDVPVQGPRERDVRNGLMFPPKVTARNALDMVRRMPWVMDVLRGPKISFGNLQPKKESFLAGAQHVAQTFDPAVTWKDVAWFRSLWDRPMVIKGVLNPADARLAVDHGIEGLVVSNHGGRQLDGASASFAALGPIVDAVGDRIEVMVDGGIRRGGDIVKCIAMGARACMIGRPYAYGLGAAGEAGVARAIQILKSEIATALGLLGVPDIRDLDRSVLMPRPSAAVTMELAR